MKLHFSTQGSHQFEFGPELGLNLIIFEYLIFKKNSDISVHQYFIPNIDIFTQILSTYLDTSFDIAHLQFFNNYVRMEMIFS